MKRIKDWLLPLYTHTHAHTISLAVSVLPRWPPFPSLSSLKCFALDTAMRRTNEWRLILFLFIFVSPAFVDFRPYKLVLSLSLSLSLYLSISLSLRPFLGYPFTPNPNFLIVSPFISAGPFSAHAVFKMERV